ncbi:MAG: sugar transferase [Paracoccus sp. (in: a-proteobacteria)]|uniref:sugar transferase n=1 Tax=Paracoccus sp. TaxID=267 RepID=UPI0026E0DF93|nr:sugar transferase [Paracoccus sp. (in: a-proteobacteria)]MDO5631460.1 sugar transferase [Paracoccus sp. (in: a-proteobacteria)]
MKKTLRQQGSEAFISITSDDRRSAATNRLPDSGLHGRPLMSRAGGGAMAFTAGPQQDDDAQSNIYRRGIKRALDVFLILLSLPIVLPVVAFMALLVARDGGKPFYSQDRIGRGGKVYRIWKLRTMVHDADARLDAYLRENPILREQWLTKQKLLDDPRITRIGRILRKTSLDELPQLFNVFKGDMSLVGPRPMMVSQKEMYPGSAYYRLRPGITGLWQVSDRNETRFSERAWYDEEYDRNLSFMTDLSILFATVRVVLRGTGH